MAEHGTIEIHPEELNELQPEDAVARRLFKSRDDEENALIDLGNWLDEEINRSEMARRALERAWCESLRQYEGVSRFRRRNTPIENAPNLEITLGAIASDAIFAQMLNLIFNISPLVTARAVAETGDFTEHAQALQRFIELISRNQLDLRKAAENAILDNCKLGTGVYYIRWGEHRRKTVVDEVIKVGPEVRAVPLEDFFVPGGSFDDLQRERWVAMRSWPTQHELNLRGRDLNWDVEGLQPTGNISRVRQARERLGRHDGFSQRKAAADSQGGELFEIFEVYCHYDIDGDGIDEDLLVAWDRTSKRVLRWSFNPYDRRPFEGMRYQLREYLFYGMGVLEMTRPFQQGATELYNHWVLNSLLANSRMWVGRHGAIPNNQLRLWPNRFLPVSDPANDIQALPMADTFPSAPAALAQTISFAERRTGINDLSAPRPSAVLGSRTPGITALSMLQKSNERFGPAFKAASIATANAVKQALFRYQERLLMNDPVAEDTIIEMLGQERGNLVISILKDKRFDQAIAIDLTAGDASTNKEADRQNWLLLLQTLAPMYERIFALSQVLASPDAPDVIRQTGQKIVDAFNEIVERTMRTFDQVRDPEKLRIDILQQLDAVPNLDPDGVGGLLTALGPGAGGEENAGDAGAASALGAPPIGG